MGNVRGRQLWALEEIFAVVWQGTFNVMVPCSGRDILSVPRLHSESKPMEQRWNMVLWLADPALGTSELGTSACLSPPQGTFPRERTLVHWHCRVSALCCRKINVWPLARSAPCPVGHLPARFLLLGCRGGSGTWQAATSHVSGVSDVDR